VYDTDSSRRPVSLGESPVDISGCRLASHPAAHSLKGMTLRSRKISLAQCVRQGNSTVTIWCVSPSERAPYGGGPNVCGHKRELPIDEVIKLFGLETSLSDFRVRCTVCGGRAYDARGEAARQLGHRWVG